MEYTEHVYHIQCIEYRKYNMAYRVYIECIEYTERIERLEYADHTECIDHTENIECIEYTDHIECIEIMNMLSKRKIQQIFLLVCPSQLPNYLEYFGYSRNRTIEIC